ncbi:D-3-phosphoglycerate dehydrogenase [Hyalella azteca]|uniref:D-3-phosphoglycerate dehydrogenase n=1 Tax=Hyalella azteca TaxID=294128 RepID=A0A6A0H1K0_HYAAZ|nr:D-3-phosphoglycerate dehydrogenase [Hyalella azteca]
MNHLRHLQVTSFLQVAHRMQAFNMTCIGYDPFVSAAAAAEWNIEALPLDEIWPRADYITVHTPLLPHTRNLLGEEVLMTKCKPGVKVVNVARGGIVDEAALLRALEAGRCGGAGLDVFTTEPPTDYALCRHPKVVCTPHLGASTFEAQERVAEELADQMVSAVSGGPIAGLVNGGALATANSSDAQPWLALASALGQVAEVIVSGPLTSVTLVPAGAFANKNLANALCSAVLAGLLKRSSSGTANLINSCVLAQDSNISCEIVPPSDELKPILPSGVDNGLLVAVSGANSNVKLVGSSANGLPLLYSVNDSSWPIAVPLSRSLVLYRSLAASSPLPAIAATLVKGGLLSLASSAGGLWHVATLDSPVTELDAKVQDVEYVGQVSL